MAPCRSRVRAGTGCSRGGTIPGRPMRVGRRAAPPPAPARSGVSAGRNPSSVKRSRVGQGHASDVCEAARGRGWRGRPGGGRGRPLRYALPMIRTVVASRYVMALREGGSLPGLVEADDDGLYVVKFRGAGQGPRALVAEWLGGEIGRAMGLPVPDLVAIEVDAALGDAEPDEDIHDLVRASAGTNLGMDFLPGALTFNPAASTAGDIIDPEFAADVVWFDGLVTNPDRSPQNPNLLVWHGRPWLIDHGAALYIHHTWRDPEAHARRSFERIRDHVLLPYAGSIEAADARNAGLIDETFLAGVGGAGPT